MPTTVETHSNSAAVDRAQLERTGRLPAKTAEHLDRALQYAVPIATALVAAGVVLRFVAPSPLWLDEALSVNIAKLPLDQIAGALRHDGAPPLFYVLLHFWILAVGDGNFAVRALSGLISVGALPLAWLAGKRLGGRRLAWAALLLTASSPFALNYAASARMYTLMMVWTLLGFLALARAFERPTPQRLAAVGAVTAAVLYTHYWGLYLVAVVAAWLLLRARGERTPVGAADPVAGAADLATRQAAWSCFTAMALGSLAFLPWLPSFVFQSLHTGTPWSNAAGLGDILTVLNEYGGSGPWGAALALTLFTLVLLGFFGESTGGHHVLVNLSGKRIARPIGFVFMGTLLLAVAGGAVAQAAFVGRYTAVVFPLFVLLAGLGVTVFPDRRVFALLLAWTTCAGLIVGVGTNLTSRTQAGAVASVINKMASPNDVVVYCPDQLGPAASRLITAHVTQYTFPLGDLPQRVNWVNYRHEIDITNVEQFADQVVSDAAGHDLWVVENPNYPGTEHKCSQLMSWLSTKRRNPQVWVADNPGYHLENESLVRFPE